MSDEVETATRLPHDRQQAIYMLALRQGSVDGADLARRYGVTTETIRRDLSDMQARHLLRRVHGGAVPIEQINHEPLLDVRGKMNAEEKLRIATMAAEEVPERGSVIIDSGSTGQRLADVFPVDRDVHVVTNSLTTALTLSRRGVARPDGPRRRGAPEHARDGRRHGLRGARHDGDRHALHQLRRPVVQARADDARTARSARSSGR